MDELCHITSVLWKGVSGKVCIVYGNPFTLFVIEGCLLVYCWSVEVFRVFVDSLLWNSLLRY